MRRLRRPLVEIGTLLAAVAVMALLAFQPLQEAVRWWSYPFYGLTADKGHPDAYRTVAEMRGRASRGDRLALRWMLEFSAHTDGGLSYCHGLHLMDLLHDLGDERFSGACLALDARCAKRALHHLESNDSRYWEEFPGRYPRTAGILRLRSAEAEG